MTDSGESDLRVQSLIDSLNTRKRTRSLDGPIEKCLHAARWLPLSIDPFVNLTAVMRAGIEKDSGDIIKGFKEQNIVNENDCKYYAYVYEEYIKLAPEMQDIAISLKDQPQALKMLIGKIVSAAGDARSEDSGSLKNAGITYLPRDPVNDTISPPIPKDQGKLARGFNHPMTARLLCPRKYLDQFDRHTHATTNSLQDGTIKVTAGDWPTFLYNEQEYDPKEKDKGLLRGYLLVRTYKHIFTGPGSSLSTNTRKGTKPSKAKLHGLHCVTPRTIAYAAAQTRFWLSSVIQWQDFDRAFSLRKFFGNIVKLFEADPEDEWCIETLRWWDEQVPGLRQSTDSSNVAVDNVDEDDLNDILTARVSRRCLANREPSEQGITSSNITTHTNTNSDDTDNNSSILSNNDSPETTPPPAPATAKGKGKRAGRGKVRRR